MLPQFCLSLVYPILLMNCYSNCFIYQPVILVSSLHNFIMVCCYSLSKCYRVVLFLYVFCSAKCELHHLVWVSRWLLLFVLFFQLGKGTQISLYLIVLLNCTGIHDMPYGPVRSPRPTPAAIIHNGRNFGR